MEPNSSSSSFSNSRTTKRTTKRATTIRADPDILADHCVAEPTIAFLREAGYTVRRLVDLAGPNMPDGGVADLAGRHGWILLTEDRDFRTRVVYHQRKHAGVILLRDAQSHRDAVHKRLLRLLDDPGRLAGCLAVIDRRSCRLLPAR